jgi:ATP phosphoribosyltransferase
VATIRLGLPKGRMKEGVFRLLGDAGVSLRETARSYRPQISIGDYDVKVLKPHNIVKMLHVGRRDLGFAGADWVAELGADLVEVLDTGMDPVQLVAAAPSDLLVGGKLPDRELVIASEYERLTRQWIDARGMRATFVLSHGATEVFPPEDADCIVDNTATGSTLRQNNLDIVDVVMRSSTRLYASRAAMDDPGRRDRIEDLRMILASVLAARKRVMLETNITADRLEALVQMLPCMREPTVAQLHGMKGYAVKVAVPRAELPTLIPAIKQVGGTDIVVSALAQIVP